MYTLCCSGLGANKKFGRIVLGNIANFCLFRKTLPTQLLIANCGEFLYISKFDFQHGKYAKSIYKLCFQRVKICAKYFKTLFSTGRYVRKMFLNFVFNGQVYAQNISKLSFHQVDIHMRKIFLNLVVNG